MVANYYLAPNHSEDEYVYSQELTGHLLPWTAVVPPQEHSVSVLVHFQRANRMPKDTCH